MKRMVLYSLSFFILIVISGCIGVLESDSAEKAHPTITYVVISSQANNSDRMENNKTIESPIISLGNGEKQGANQREAEPGVSLQDDKIRETTTDAPTTEFEHSEEKTSLYIGGVSDSHLGIDDTPSSDQENSNGVELLHIVDPPAEGYDQSLLELVEVIFDTSNNIFPTSWLSTRISAKATPISEREVTRSKIILSKSMRKYPKHVLLGNLKKIYVVQRLEYFGISAAGTNSLDRIYLANRGVSESFTDSFVERKFHGEFSSILLRNYPENFNTAEWVKQNPKDFSYTGRGVSAVQSGRASTAFESTYLYNGFLNEYSTSTLENDFNSIVQNMFKSNNGFWEVVDNNEKVRNKFLIAVDFYNKIDPIFTEEYFREIS